MAQDHYNYEMKTYKPMPKQITPSELVAKTSALYHEKQKVMAAKAFKKKAEEEKESKEKVAPSKFKRPKLT